MNGGHRRVLSDATWITCASVIAQVMTALAAVIVARTGGTTEFGVLTIGLGVVAIASDVTDLGCGAHIARETAAKRISLRQALTTTIRKMRIFVFIAVIATSVSFILQFSYWELGMILSVYYSGSALNLSLSLLLRAEQMFARAALVVVLDRVILLALTFGLTWSGIVRHTAWSFGLGLIAGSFTAGLVGYLTLLRRREGPAGYIPLGELYRQSRHLGYAGLATDLNSLEGPIVGLAAGPSIAGQFGAAQRFAGPLAMPAGSVAAALLPRLSAQKNGVRGAVSDSVGLKWLLAPLVLVLGGLIVVSDWIVEVVFGPSFGHATSQALQFVCVGVLFTSVNQVLFNICVSTQLESVLSKILGLTIPSGLVLCALGAWVGGAPLAVLGGVMSQAVTTLFVVRAIRRRLASERHSPIDMDSHRE